MQSALYSLCCALVAATMLQVSAAQVSGWFVMTTADVRRVAEPWLRFSEDVRLDPEVCLLLHRHIGVRGLA